MEISSFSDLDILNKYVAHKILGEFKHNPHSTHFLPTGNTYLGCYQELINLLTTNHRFDFSQLVLVNLDEYIENGQPLSAQDSRSFASYMEPIITALEKHGFDRQNHLFPYSLEEKDKLNKFQRLHKFDQWVQKIDCASVFLGLGPKESPHIAFCSPGYTSIFNQQWQDIGAYVSPVDEVTRQANFSNPGMNDRLSVPYWAATISPGTILSMKPKRVYLVAYGKNKDVSVINRSCDVGENPASILRILARGKTLVEIITLK